MNIVHAPGVRPAQADAPVEGIPADPDVVAATVTLEVDRADEIDLV
jgi:hypothetical protein